MIAIAVAALWACILLEQSVVRNANDEAHQALQQIRSLRAKRTSEPASIPPLKHPPSQQRIPPSRRTDFPAIAFRV